MFTSVISSQTCCTTSTKSTTKKKTDKTYNTIKLGLKKSVPAAIVLWAFHKIPSKEGLTSRRVIGFLKKHYQLANDPRKTGKKFGAMLRCAVEFGLLEKRGNKYFVKPQSR